MINIEKNSNQISIENLEEERFQNSKLTPISGNSS